MSYPPFRRICSSAPAGGVTKSVSSEVTRERSTLTLFSMATNSGTIISLGEKWTVSISSGDIPQDAFKRYELSTRRFRSYGSFSWMAFVLLRTRGARSLP